MRHTGPMTAALLAWIWVGAPPVAALELEVQEGPTAVFSWARDRCETWHIPDAPARAFRGADGEIRLIAAHNRNRVMRGPDLQSLRVDCRIVFRGADADAPESYDDKLWLSATWTEDGRTIHALAHAEFHGQRRPALCPIAQYMACWRNQMIHVVSGDGGESFIRHGVALVAGIPYRFDGAAGKRSGYFEPSNIFRHGDGLYAFVWAEGYEAQKRGACLLRTTDIADPGAWRAWDGKGFTVVFRDAYRDTIAAPARHVCQPIPRLDGVVASVSRHRATGEFIAIFASNRRKTPDSAPQPGIWYATSSDLLTWTEPRLLRALPLMWAFTCGERAVWAYPSLLDPQSPARNFDDVGARAELYLTRFNLGADCKLPPDRDLVRFGVAIRG